MPLLYEIPSLKHIDVRAVKEAVSWLGKYGKEARVMAGGTDLLSLMKDRVEVPGVLVNIKPIPRMNRIAYDEGRGLKIGAAVTLNNLEMSDVILEKFPLLADAARQVGTTQVRNMGTIGGNVAIRFATSETLPALIALRANARLASAGGERTVAIEELYKEMKAPDLLTAIDIPAAAGARVGYHKFALRERFDYAVVSAAVNIEFSGKTCKDVIIGLGGVTLPTMRAKKAEELLKGQAITEALVKKAARAAADGGSIGSDLMFSADYKKKVLAVMVERAIKEASGRVTKEATR